MNDNNSEFHADRRHAAQLAALKNLNIGANGRWFILALVAIAIAAGFLKFAVVLAAFIGVSVILEQMNGRLALIGLYALYAWAAVLAVVLLVIV